MADFQFDQRFYNRFYVERALNYREITLIS